LVAGLGGETEAETGGTVSRARMRSSEFSVPTSFGHVGTGKVGVAAAGVFQEQM